MQEIQNGMITEIHLFSELLIKYCLMYMQLYPRNSVEWMLIVDKRFTIYNFLGIKPQNRNTLGVPYNLISH